MVPVTTRNDDFRGNSSGSIQWRQLGGSKFSAPKMDGFVIGTRDGEGFHEMEMEHVGPKNPEKKIPGYPYRKLHGSYHMPASIGSPWQWPYLITELNPRLKVFSCNLYVYCLESHWDFLG